jgi:hypothetical protein
MGKGQDQIRSALIRRRNKLMTISERTGCGLAALDAYSRAEVALSPPVLDLLAQELFGGRYDASTDAIFLTGA